MHLFRNKVSHKICFTAVWTHEFVPTALGLNHGTKYDLSPRFVRKTYKEKESELIFNF